MEGPQFSTLAESNLYRSWGVDVIGMTNLQEAKLAREAEIAYATMALVTDYDCWHPEHDAVTIDMIIGYLTANVKMAQEVIAKVVERLDVAPSRSGAQRVAKRDPDARRCHSRQGQARSRATHRQIRQVIPRPQDPRTS